MTAASEGADEGISQLRPHRRNPHRLDEDAPPLHHVTPKMKLLSQTPLSFSKQSLTPTHPEGDFLLGSFVTNISDDSKPTTIGGLP